MNKTELKKLLALHEKWLDHRLDPKQFKDPGKQLDLSGKDLTGIDLSNKRLVMANLSGAKLDCTNLSHASLIGANLSNAELDNAILSDAILDDADLTDAHMSGANLTNASLQDANLTGAHLYMASFYRADMRWATLNHAYLLGANLMGADLYKTDFSHANLRDANLAMQNLTDTNITGAEIYYANLSGTKFSKEDRFRKGVILSKPMIGYKYSHEFPIITLEIPAGAVVFCIDGIHYRTNIAKVIDIEKNEVLHSYHDNNFEYRLNETIVIPDFDLNYTASATTGIHFFRTKKEAKENYGC